MQTPTVMSPLELLQEQLRGDPWRVLVACVMLNQTHNRQVKQVIWKFFKRWPSADSVREDDVDEIVAMIRPLGFYSRRAKSIVKMSMKYVGGGWKDPRELPGIGKYAADSYKIFVEGSLDVEPTDDRLVKYKAWAQEQCT